MPDDEKPGTPAAPLDILHTRHRRVGPKEPTVRTQADGGNYLQRGANPISPLLLPNPSSGCAVVDVFYNADDVPKLRLAQYLGLNQTATYIVVDPLNCWLVDLPKGVVFTSKRDIREAIVRFLDRSGTKPPGPPDWPT
jgi:hypothetical protein